MPRWTVELASKELVGIIAYLLPGFLAAWIFYGLTGHPKGPPFERVVQALIFTAILQGVVCILRWLAAMASYAVVFGVWTENVTLVWSLVLAALLGVTAAGIANNDVIHEWLRYRDWKFFKSPAPGSAGGWAWTRRTSYPSEWYSAFSRNNGRYIIIYLKDARRLFGWPEEWPDACDRGHFVLSECEWLLPTGERAALYRVECMLIPATSVEFVEFLIKRDCEVTASEEDLRKAEEMLVRANQKETPDGSQIPATTPKPAQ